MEPSLLESSLLEPSSLESSSLSIDQRKYNPDAALKRVVESVVTGLSPTGETSKFLGRNSNVIDRMKIDQVDLHFMDEQVRLIKWKFYTKRMEAFLWFGNLIIELSENWLLCD